MNPADARQHVVLTRDKKYTLVSEASEQLTSEGLLGLTYKALSERAAKISKEKQWGDVKASTIENYLHGLSDEKKKTLRLWVAVQDAQRPRRKALRKEVRQIDYPSIVASLPPEKKTKRGLIEAAGVEAWKVESYLFQNPKIARLLDDG